MAYLGPGDIVGSAGGWWGLRAYTGAYAAAGSPCVKIADSTYTTAGTGHETTINVTSTGLVDVAAINSWITSFGSPARITGLIDQTGNGNNLVISGSITTTAPTITLTPAGLLSGRVAMTFSAIQTLFSQAAIPSHTQPITILVFQYRTSTAQATSGLGNTVSVGLLGAGNAVLYAGSLAPIAIGSDLNTWHSFGGVFNGSSSIFEIDGANTGSQVTGTGAANGSDAFTLNNASAMTGMICEAGYWPVGVGSWTSTALNTWGNQASGSVDNGSVTFWIGTGGAAAPIRVIGGLLGD